MGRSCTSRSMGTPPPHATHAFAIGEPERDHGSDAWRSLWMNSKSGRASAFLDARFGHVADLCNQGQRRQLRFHKPSRFFHFGHPSFDAHPSIRPVVVIDCQTTELFTKLRLEAE